MYALMVAPILLDQAPAVKGGTTTAVPWFQLRVSRETLAFHHSLSGFLINLVDVHQVHSHDDCDAPDVAVILELQRYDPALDIAAECVQIR